MPKNIIEHQIPITYALDVVHLYLDFTALRPALFTAALLACITVAFQRRLPFAGSKPEAAQRGTGSGPRRGEKAAAHFCLFAFLPNKRAVPELPI
jgi:hypothetical protein